MSMFAGAASPEPQPVFESPKDSTLPKVFFLGEHEMQFEKLVGEYQKLLLTACGNDLSKAFERWQSVSLSMEAFSKEQKFDLDGVKAWVYIFWNPAGKIDHIAYHLKPGSRFVKPGDLNPFLEKFMAQFQLPVTATFKFSHYGTVVFPNQK